MADATTLKRFTRCAKRRAGPVTRAKRAKIRLCQEALGVTAGGEGKAKGGRPSGARRSPAAAPLAPLARGGGSPTCSCSGSGSGVTASSCSSGTTEHPNTTQSDRADLETSCSPRADAETLRAEAKGPRTSDAGAAGAVERFLARCESRQREAQKRLQQKYNFDFDKEAPLEEPANVEWERTPR